MNKRFFVYIATNRSNTLYTGMTNDLVKRMYEHKNKLNLGFTQKYNIDKLRDPSPEPAPSIPEGAQDDILIGFWKTGDTFRVRGDKIKIRLY